MEPIKHKYKLGIIMKVSAFLFDLLAIIYFLVCIFVVTLLIMDNDFVANWPYLLVFLASGVSSLVSFPFLGHLLTEITSDDVGLHFMFLWKKITISWSEIIDFVPLHKGKGNKSAMLVQAKTLPWFHRFYGLVYSFSFIPSLVVPKTIGRYTELNERIKIALIQYNRKTSTQ